MKQTKHMWDFLSKEQREGLVREIIAHHDTEHDEKIGFLAAEAPLDFFLNMLGPEIYNKAIEDSKHVMKQSFENLEVDMSLLTKQNFR